MNIQNILPRRSRRLATIIPASHWISICLYSEDIARGMETLQHTMNKYYEEGDNGDNTNVVRLLPNVAFDEVDDDFDFDVMFDDLSDKMLPNHEMMLPHWKKFAKWLNGRGTKTDLLEISRIALPLPVLNVMLPAFRGINMTALFLRGNELGSEGAAIMADFISSNPPKLQFLYLSNNIFSDDDTVLFASALRRNTNLHMLSLNNNDITVEGEKILFNSVYDATTMNSIEECNHKCLILTFDLSNEEAVTEFSTNRRVELESININGEEKDTVEQKIRKKAILTLCGVDSALFDLGYLNGFPLQLIPNVLELLQKHTEVRTDRCSTDQLQKDSFSRVFHTLRGWEMPLLFEKRSLATSVTGKRKRRSMRRRV